MVNDYRNAHRVITHLLRKFPKNPYVLSKVARFYLEVGNRAEAAAQIKKVQQMMLEVKKQRDAPDAD
jgi:predicted Zn-dependent protease